MWPPLVRTSALPPRPEWTWGDGCLHFGCGKSAASAKKYHSIVLLWHQEDVLLKNTWTKDKLFDQTASKQQQQQLCFGINWSIWVIIFDRSMDMNQNSVNNTGANVTAEMACRTRRWLCWQTCLTGYREPIVCTELNLGQFVISVGSKRNWRPL